MKKFHFQKMRKQDKPITLDPEREYSGTIQKIVDSMENDFGINLSDIQFFSSILKISANEDMKKKTHDPKKHNREFFIKLITKMMEEGSQTNPNAMRLISTYSISRLLSHIDYGKIDIIMSYIAVHCPNSMREYGDSYFPSLKEKIHPNNTNYMQIVDDLWKEWNGKIDKLQEFVKNPPLQQQSVVANPPLQHQSVVINDYFSMDFDYDNDQNLDLEFHFKDDDNEFNIESLINYEGF